MLIIWLRKNDSPKYNDGLIKPDEGNVFENQNINLLMKIG